MFFAGQRRKNVGSGSWSCENGLAEGEGLAALDAVARLKHPIKYPRHGHRAILEYFILSRKNESTADGIPGA
jgi:hypothetical protein